MHLSSRGAPTVYQDAAVVYGTPVPWEGQQHMVLPPAPQHLPWHMQGGSLPGDGCRPLTGPAAVQSDNMQVADCWTPPPLGAGSAFPGSFSGEGTAASTW